MQQTVLRKVERQKLLEDKSIETVDHLGQERGKRKR